MAPAAEQWSFFLERCFQKRVRSDQFARLSSQLLARTAISGRELAELLLKPRSFASSVLDPLAPAYLEHLLGTNRLDVADILVSAFKWSRDHPHPPSDDAAAEKTGTKFAYNPVELDEFLLQRIGRTFSSGERPQKLSEARTCVVLAAQWMSAMVSSHATDTVLLAMEGEGQDHMRIALARVALGSFVAQLLENPKVNGLVGSALPKRKSDRAPGEHAPGQCSTDPVSPVKSQRLTPLQMPASNYPRLSLPSSRSSLRRPCTWRTGWRCFRNSCS